MYNITEKDCYGEKSKLNSIEVDCNKLYKNWNDNSS